jgi:hypothetical protein
MGQRTWRGVAGVPAGLILSRRHRRKLAVDGDQALERPLWLWAHHLGVDLHQHATLAQGRENGEGTSLSVALLGAGGTQPCFAQ